MTLLEKLLNQKDLITNFGINNPEKKSEIIPLIEVYSETILDIPIAIAGIIEE